MKEQLKKLVAFVTSALMALALVPGIALAADAATVTPNGSGSITISNAVKGETYTVYRLFNAQANAATHAIVYGKLNADQDLGTYFTLDGEGYVVPASGTTDSTIGTSEFKTWATTAGTKVNSNTATTNGELKFENLSYGYYYVTSTQGTAISVDSLNPDATITDKNSSTPTVPKDAKKIVLSDGTTADSTSAAVGEDLNFQIKFDARNYDGNDLVTKYTIKDTPTNLSIKTNTVKVQVIENPEATDASKVDHDITNEITSGIEETGLNFDISWVDSDNASKYANKSQIVVTYTATVTSGADAGEAHNSAEISWNNKTPEKPNEPKVYTYGFTVQKVDGKDGLTQLDGAEFKLYTAGGTEVPVVAVKGSDGKVLYYRPAVTGETGVNIVAGNVTVKGLKEGSYQLEEEVAPKGYNKLTEKTAAFTVNSDSSKNGVDVTVKNNQGAELPTTGGMGTTLFTVVGSALVVAAGVLLVTRRRMQQ